MVENDMQNIDNSIQNMMQNKVCGILSFDTRKLLRYDAFYTGLTDEVIKYHILLTKKVDRLE